MTPPVAAITFDLDDTLWPIAPVIEHAERTLEAWLARHLPRTFENLSQAAWQGYRDRLIADYPQRAHDFSFLRLEALRLAIREAGEDPSLAERGFDLFFRARHAVTYFPDVERALERLASHLPLVALTNGNAEVERLAIGRHFRFAIHARNHPQPKPHRPMFDAAAERLGLAPESILHVGDSYEHDVLGAQGAGFQAAWLMRGASIPSTSSLVFSTLDELTEHVLGKTDFRAA